MCYEVSITKKKRRLEEHFGSKMFIPEEYKPSYHLSGFSHPNLLAIDQQSIHKIVSMEWGLVAPWASKNEEDFRKKYNTLNARGENILNSNMYKHAAQENRCLILADGFFEPHSHNGITYPFYCYLQNREPFAFAGIYEDVNDKFTCSLLTVEANAFFAEVHNKKKRMPLVLDPEVYRWWLENELKDSEINDIIENGFISEKFESHPVSRDLYDRSRDTNSENILEYVPMENTLF